MISGRVAVLADVHANAWALEAVFRDARTLGVTGYVNLGDVLYGPLKPRETFELLVREPAIGAVRGNQDRDIYAATAREMAGNATLAYVAGELGVEAIEWLRGLPPTAVVEGDMFLCHGTPTNDLTYFLEDVSSGWPVVRSDAAILELLGGVTQPLVLCGHTHIPRLVRLPTGQAIVNPGSVGLPAYRDDQPVSHAIENYSPHASYAIVERNDGQWDVTFRRVAYDHEAAARQASARRREDWAQYLATGRCR